MVGPLRCGELEKESVRLLDDVDRSGDTRWVLAIGSRPDFRLDELT